MTPVDIIVLISVLIVLGLIIFFQFYVPKKKGIPMECSSCPAKKHAKKYLKQYRKANKK